MTTTFFIPASHATGAHHERHWVRRQREHAFVGTPEERDRTNADDGMLGGFNPHDSMFAEPCGSNIRGRPRIYSTEWSDDTRRQASGVMSLT